MIWSTTSTRRRPWKRGHWFRTASTAVAEDRLEIVALQICAYTGCGRPGYEHWTWVGEWMLPDREVWKLRWRRFRIMRREKERHHGAR